MSTATIFVTGHRGLVGSALIRRLTGLGDYNLLVRTHQELDLINQSAVNDFFANNQIDYVFLAAAKVGGILYNSQYQADFLYENMMIAGNVIKAAHEFNIKKLIYLGSSCIYPKHAPQPIKEECLLAGPLEPTNEGYAIAKIAGLKLCEKFRLQYGKDFVAVMPTNLYGPGDNYHPEHSHVIPGLLNRLHHAKINNLPEVEIWGSGAPRREFLHVDDLAEALILLLKTDTKNFIPDTAFHSIINIGSGVDIEIKELALLIKKVVGYQGEVVFDLTKPDGTPRKVLDISRISNLGWKPKIELEAGLEESYRWAIENNKI